MQLALGLMIPFAGTALGSAMVFWMRREMNKKVEKMLLGFASGVMIAASVWSLLIPAIDMAAEQGRIAWLPAAVGFLGGIAFLLGLDSLVPHLHLESTEPEGLEANLKKNNYACPGGDAAQYSGRYVGGGYFCGCAVGQYRYHDGRSIHAGGRNRYPEFPGRSYHLHAA